MWKACCAWRDACRLWSHKASTVESSRFPRHQEVPGYTVGNKCLCSARVPDTLPKPIMSLSTRPESGIGSRRKTCQWKRQTWAVHVCQVTGDRQCADEISIPTSCSDISSGALFYVRRETLRHERCISIPSSSPFPVLGMELVKKPQ